MGGEFSSRAGMDGAAGVSPVPLTCEECRESRGRHPRSGTLRERQLQAFREDRTGCAPCPPPLHPARAPRENAGCVESPAGARCRRWCRRGGRHRSSWLRSPAGEPRRDLSLSEQGEVTRGWEASRGRSPALSTSGKRDGKGQGCSPRLLLLPPWERRRRRAGLYQLAAASRPALERKVFPSSALSRR